MRTVRSEGKCTCLEFGALFIKAGLSESKSFTATVQAYRGLEFNSQKRFCVEYHKRTISLYFMMVHFIWQYIVMRFDGAKGLKGVKHITGRHLTVAEHKRKNKIPYHVDW